MNKLKYRLTSILALFVSLVTIAQEQVNTNSISVQERTQQSIYIVMAVVITIVVGLFLYLVNIDRKLSKLEKESGK